MIQTTNGRFLPAQREDEFLAEALRRSLPWTTADYETLRKAVLALVRTHTSWDRPDGTIRPSFDGDAYWAVLGALDRAQRLDVE